VVIVYVNYKSIIGLSTKHKSEKCKTQKKNLAFCQKKKTPYDIMVAINPHHAPQLPSRLSDWKKKDQKKCRLMQERLLL
jgi:hypothetical protein